MAVSGALPPLAQRITGAATLGRMILSASERGDEVALRHPVGESFDSISYRELGEHAREIACGLIALGIERGDVVSIFSSTRVEWTLCEAGALCAGAVTAPIYNTNSPEECRHVLADSGARLVFCEGREQAAKVAQVRGKCPALEHVIVIEGDADGASPLADLRRRGEAVEADEVGRRVDGVAPGDVATLVYTSGTTGPPKGCMLTHSNFLAATAMCRGQLELDHVQPVIYMFLPLAHVLARIAQMVVLDVGGTLVYWRGDAARILEEVAESEPTHFVAVPRIFEKMHTGVLAALEDSGLPSRLLFAWALEVGRRARSAERAGRTRGPLASMRLGLADRLGLAKVRALFGPRLRLALVGAAPIDHELLEFFDACGVLVLEGYGMTESCATATLNPPSAPRFGSVGRALPGSEVMVAEDGEVLLRGPHVFAGYHGDPEATAAAFADGWLKTGDTGSLTAHGYLKLTGRKKDLIITSSGKNITPVNIESALRETRWISEAIVFGDRRPYLVCLLTLDPDEAPKLARQLRIPADPESMARDERVRAVIQADVDMANARFARIEQVKRFGILDHQLTQSAGELTPTLKIKRNVVYERYSAVFADLYAEQP
ncbi:MAG TPA: long-chain fatty acid--CoA ligase [Solirubrobacteraceae bacterium]